MYIVYMTVPWQLQVVVPQTYPEYTSRRVLTTSWLEGEKLSGSTASDVGDLVNLGVICYLKQLLDTGFFHVSSYRLVYLHCGLLLDTSFFHVSISKLIVLSKFHSLF